MLQIDSPILRQLHDDWNARRRGRRFPARRDFDPLDLKYIVGNLSLVDVLYEPIRFYYRLHGTNVAQRFGYELTGKELSANPNADGRALIKAHFEAVLDERRPIVQPHRFVIADGTVFNHEALVLPLAQDGERIDMLMSAVAFG